MGVYPLWGLAPESVQISKMRVSKSWRNCRSIDEYRVLLFFRFFCGCPSGGRFFGGCVRCGWGW